MKLTKPQRAALQYLYDNRLGAAVYPNEIGYAMQRAKKARGEPICRGGLGMTAQGAGRVGGSMGSRLVKMGLASFWERGYTINIAGETLIESTTE